MPNNPEIDKRYETLSKNHDQKLNGIIKEINELSDTNGGNDKIESDLIVNNELNEGLKGYLESNKDVAKLLVDKIETIDASNLSEEVEQSLQNLVKLLSGVVNGPVEGDETAQEVINPSFDKFKKMIKEGKLNKLNTLKDREVQDVINFVNDSNNDITSLNLFDDMVKQEIVHGGDKNFRHTDRENFHKVSDAIRTHFNMLEGAGIETAQRIQLDKIFDGMEGENVKKEDLQKLYENYVGGEWNGEPIDGNIKFNKEVIVSSQDFADKFNSLIPKPEDIEHSEDNSETTETGGEGGFEDIDIKEGLAIDEINKYITDNGGKSIFRKKVQGEGTDNKEQGEEKEKGGYECNMENTKDFLKKIGNDIKFDKNFIAVKTPSRKAWLSAVQILFNKEHEGTLKVDGQYVRGGETYTAVKNFQEKYNESKKVDGKYPEGFEPLVEDGIPGPKTLSKLLGTSVDDNSSTGEDSSRIVDVDESLNRVSGTIEGVGKFLDLNFTFDDSVEQGDDEGGHYAIIGTEKYYESNGSMNGLGYFSGINPDNQGYFYIGNIKDGKCGGLGTMTWTSGEKYVGNWENNRRSGDGTLTFSNGNEYIGEFNDGSATKGLLTLKLQDGAIKSFNVERDDSGLKITSGDNEGKYIDPKSRDITDTPSD